MSESSIYIASTAEGPLLQGEILSNLSQAYLVLPSEPSDETLVEFNDHSYVIVVSQDCDLEQEYNARNRIPVKEGSPPQSVSAQISNILFCEVHSLDELRETHNFTNRIIDPIKSNSLERYQRCRDVAPHEDFQGIGITDIVVDFRKHFTLPCNEVYYQLENNACRCAVLNTPYLQSFMDRFYNYMKRIALPAPH